MTITTRDQLINGLGNNSSRIVLDKASIGFVAYSNYVSMWRATGQPGQGAIPGAAANCNNATLGAIEFTQQSAPATSYGAYLEAVFSNNTMTLELHDRLIHMGGLNGTLTTAQTVGIDLNGITADNMANRIGDSNYSNVQWWLEWYTATGATAVTATVSVVYFGGTTGTLTVSLAATRPASQMIPLNGLIPAVDAGKFIRGVTSVTLSATTGTAGSFGVTATRQRMAIGCPLGNFKAIADWAQLGLPEIYNSSCLFPVAQTNSTTTGTLRGCVKIAHG